MASLLANKECYFHWIHWYISGVKMFFCCVLNSLLAISQVLAMWQYNITWFVIFSFGESRPAYWHRMVSLIFVNSGSGNGLMPYGGGELFGPWNRLSDCVLEFHSPEWPSDWLTRPLMMTSSNGSIFRVTGHLSRSPVNSPHTKASDAEL